ncbi:MAG TPA: carbohydrate-binding protein, partial [Prolixibacteraceae bacterium]|nr:carbohydrate-binding protein [Prolixibacteraceae bacterium]
KNRSICADSLFFNADGTMQKVTPTLRGVGVTSATNKIEIDRYSNKSDNSASVAFLDTVNTFNGWKTLLDSKNAWVQYNTVDFGKEKRKKVQVKAFSEKGSILQIRLDKADGLVIAEVKVPQGTNWNTVEAKVSKFQAGIHNMVVVLKDENRVEIDWVQFK